MIAKLVPMLPQCHTYVEPFGGGASVLFARTPSPVEVYNDLDSGLVGFFRVIADPTLFAQFYRRVEALPYAREIYDDCRSTWADQTDLIERTWRWFVVARQSFSGDFGGGSWGSSVTTSTRGMAATCSQFFSTIDALPEISVRLRRVQIEHIDWRVILDRYDTLDTLFYLDPPYIHSTRSASKYRHEMVDSDHIDLVERLLKIRGMAALSGYNNTIYDRLYNAGWDRIQWHVVCSAAGRTQATGIRGKGSLLCMQPRTEVLWRNPACVAGRRNFSPELLKSALSRHILMKQHEQLEDACNE